MGVQKVLHSHSGMLLTSIDKMYAATRLRMRTITVTAATTNFLTTVSAEGSETSAKVNTLHARIHESDN